MSCHRDASSVSCCATCCYGRMVAGHLKHSFTHPTLFQAAKPPKLFLLGIRTSSQSGLSFVNNGKHLHSQRISASGIQDLDTERPPDCCTFVRSSQKIPRRGGPGAWHLPKTRWKSEGDQRQKVRGLGLPQALLFPCLLKGR